MANIQERRDKDGKLISYSIRVHRGRGADGKQLKPYTATFDVAPTWTESSAQKKANAFAAVFEKQCREGLTSDTRQTFQEHHRLISTVLEQAVREGLIPFNPARRTQLPKQTKRQVNYFQREEVEAIRDALEGEPLKWKTITHLLLVSGARRGEILGLKWDKVDFEHSRIYICNNVVYTPDRGVYEDTPKTAESVRYITLPKETMALLQRHKAEQLAQQLAFEPGWTQQNFVFTRVNGGVMHPDSVTDWLSKFSKRHDLPHVNPHAFRHTMASILYFNGVDSVSISKRLGHAQVSTTANIYAHVMEEADQKNADIIGELFL